MVYTVYLGSIFLVDNIVAGSGVNQTPLPKFNLLSHRALAGAVTALDLGQNMTI
jgi:hypothetical protein